MTELYRELVKFAEKLTEREEYKQLNISITEDRSLLDDSNPFSIKSNSRIGIKNSMQAESEIRDFLNRESLNYPNDNHLCFNIEFEMKKTGDINTGQKDKILENVSSFASEEPKFSLDDVVLPEDTLEDIRNALSMVENYDLIFNQWGWKEKEPAAKTILCFYGEPGTGKTMCAHAIAKFLKKQILIAAYADIQSEYVGVGPKNLKAVFEQAEKDNAVLFFDEADSFLRKRTSDTSSSASMHYNSMTNEMMKHLEDFNGLVIFATNLTENTDEAFKTRITCSVEFKVPDEKSRAKIISYMMPQNVPLVCQFSDDDYLKIAKSCDGFVGRDIRNAVKSVLTEGARNNTFPFSCDSFVSGFEHYKENKEKLNNSINGKNDDEHVDILDLYTETNCILALVTYSAWFDGEETEKESKVLKEKAKLLNRNKQIIGRLSDLPSLEEICEGIKHSQSKLTAVEYISDVLAISDNDENNKNFFKDVITLLALTKEESDLCFKYYGIAQEKRRLYETIEEKFTEKHNEQIEN